MEYTIRRTAIERPYEALSELRLPPNKNRGKNKRVAKRQLPRNHSDPRKNVSARARYEAGGGPLSILPQWDLSNEQGQLFIAIPIGAVLLYAGSTVLKSKRKWKYSYLN